MKKNKTDPLQLLSDTQQYFLSLQNNNNPLDNKELLLNLTTITSSIILASDEKTRRERINVPANRTLKCKKKPDKNPTPNNNE